MGDFAVIGVQLCSTIIAIFPCVALSYKNYSLFRNRGLLPTPNETYGLNLSALTLSIWSFRMPTSIFCTKELYDPGLPPFLFAQPPSPQHTISYCNALQHTATRCNKLQHTAAHYLALQPTATHHRIGHTTQSHLSHTTCHTAQIKIP